ncbi:hypothetical protein F4810DRAFT_192520 [Camillea tinctor]|nr:hypothetical protein F4810DRAFT_192520 [Camillea tinctor]
MVLIANLPIAHKMKDGNRVVHIDVARAKRNVAHFKAKAQAEAAERATKAASKPTSIMPSPPCPSTPQQEQEYVLATPPSIPSVIWPRPDTPVTPTPAPQRTLPPSVVEAPTGVDNGNADYDIRGFRNPDLNDKPPDFTPSTFKPKIDYDNDFTWSSWDSRSTEFSYHEWVTPTAPSGALERLACKHPDLALRIRNAMAGLPMPDPKECLNDLSPGSLDSPTSSFWSSRTATPMFSVDTFDSTPSSNWVWVDEEPWPERPAIWNNTLLARDWMGVEEGAGFRKYIRTLVQFGEADPPSDDPSSEKRAVNEVDAHLAAHSRFARKAQSTLLRFYGPDVPRRAASTPSPASMSSARHFKPRRRIPTATTTTTTTTIAPTPPSPAPAKKPLRSAGSPSLAPPVQPPPQLRRARRTPTSSLN